MAVMLRRICVVALAAALLLPDVGSAQSSAPPGVDLELYDPVTGVNRLCAEMDTSFWVNLFVRPGDGHTRCDLGCGPAAGGSANLATAVVDVAFDPGRLTLEAAENNPDPTLAAVDGLIQTQNLSEGRLGWALAGDWTPDADPVAGVLADPCSMGKLDRPDWVLRMRLTVSAAGMTTVRLRRATDPSAFALSFADICGSPAFTELNGAVDEVGDLVVLVADACADVVFFDNLERRDTSAWSQAIGLPPPTPRHVASREAPQ